MRCNGLQFVFTLGEKIIIRLCPTEEETVALLSKVLNGNRLASEALAKVVHQDVFFSDPALESVEVSIPQDILGIWVDPIGKQRRVFAFVSLLFLVILFLKGGGVGK